jgi:hypothetical protein
MRGKMILKVRVPELVDRPDLAEKPKAVCIFEEIHQPPRQVAGMP